MLPWCIIMNLCMYDTYVCFIETLTNKALSLLVCADAQFFDILQLELVLISFKIFCRKFLCIWLIVAFQEHFHLRLFAHLCSCFRQTLKSSNHTIVIAPPWKECHKIFMSHFLWLNSNSLQGYRAFTLWENIGDIQTCYQLSGVWGISVIWVIYSNVT